MRLSRYIDKDLQTIPSKVLYTKFGSEPEDVVELHMYSVDRLIASNHELESFTLNTFNPSKNLNTEPHAELDVHNDVRQFGFRSGRYNLQYNFFRNIISHEGHIDGLYVKEISSSRTEIRVGTTSLEKDFLSDIRSFLFDRGSNTHDCFEDLLLNFGDNYQALVTGWRKDSDGGIMFKLYEPLERNIEVKDKLWVVKEMAATAFYRIKLVPAEAEGVGRFIPGPNFELKIKKSITPSTFETWDSVLGYNKDNRQKLLNKYVSGSDSQAQLNVDYRNYNQFVHFSSAKERLENFKYKLRLLEAYSSSLATIDSIPEYSKSVITKANETEWESKIEDIKNGFDGYENYLYYETSSYVSNSLGVYPDTTWPKTTDSLPYGIATVDSTEGVAWFTSQSNVALEYDVVINEHNLENTIPFHIREDEDNQNYITFVNMTGHHFDEVWTYLSHSSDINSRENPLYDGISKDVIYNVLASFGWESFQGFHFNDLWEYALGTDAEANYSMENNNISAQLIITNESNAGLNDGFAKVVHHSGKPPYTYSWTTGQSTQQIGPVADGAVEVKVKDDDNKSVILTGTIGTNAAVPIVTGAIVTGFATGTPASVNVTGSSQIILASPTLKSGSISREEMSRETWKRMLNNIPHLLKTKGSERGIKALIATYGLPPTLLRVFEYGGPRKSRKTGSFVKYDKFSYSLEFTGSSFVQGAWKKVTNHPYDGTTNRTPDAIELRFNTWTPTSQSLLSLGSEIHFGICPHPQATNPASGYYNFGAVVADINSGVSGDPIMYTDWMPIYDNDWWNVVASRVTASYNGASQTFKVSIAKSPDHGGARVTHTSSVFVQGQDGGNSNDWNKSLTARLGGNQADTNYARFSGSMQEFRYWMFPYEDQTTLDEWNSLESFHNHTRDPQQIEGVGATGSYNQLIGRWSLGADLNRYSQSWIPANANLPFMSSSAPSAWRLPDPYSAGTIDHLNYTPVAFGMDLSIDWPTEEERYFTPMPDLVGTKELSDKTRIESSTLTGRLTNERKVERSQYDKSPLDSNRLGVYFAPSFEIDIDIARELGGARFDNFVGNPLDYRDDEYKRLRVLRNHYWYKHQNPYDFYDYIKILRHLDHTLFKQIEQIVPARCNAQIGLLVKPNMLERPKLKQPVAERFYHDIAGTLDASNYHVKANTTVLGGPMHQWFNPLSNKWESGHVQAGTQALNAHTRFMTYASNSFIDNKLYTEQSEGELVVFLDTRTHHGHDLEDNGARYIWRYLHAWTWTHPSSGSYVQGQMYQTPAAYQQQSSATYENNFEFFQNQTISSLSHWEIEHLVDRQSTESHGTISPTTAFKVNQKLKNNVPRKAAHKQASGPNPLHDKFFGEDFGVIPNYYRGRMSRKYLKEKFYYFSPKNNMHNSASTGNHPTSAVSMSGWSPAELSNGWYRSGIRPVSRSYERAEVSDYRTHAQNNLYHGGCKLVGFDFNMPVLTTVDGGPVVEFTDTSPNRIMIANRTADGGDIVATGQTMTRGV